MVGQGSRVDLHPARQRQGTFHGFFPARTDPRAEQASLLGAQHERLRWETRLPWRLPMVEEASGVADVTVTKRDMEYELALRAIVGLIPERPGMRFSTVGAGRT